MTLKRKKGERKEGREKKKEKLHREDQVNTVNTTEVEFRKKNTDVAWTHHMTTGKQQWNLTRD